MIELRDYQAEGLAALWDYFQAGKKGNPIIAWPTGCHIKGTKILMYDGTLKNVEDICINDLLMGPDSEPRKVLSLARGNQPMVRVIPIKGEEFIVNIGHIFSLKSTSNQNKRIVGLGKGIVNIIPFIDYELSSKWFKHTKKLYRVAIQFNNKCELPFSAYNMGVFLGDGGYSHGALNITSQDEIILKSFVNEACDYPFRVSNNGSKAFCVHFSSKCKIAIALTELGLKYKNSGTKFIPQIYKISSRKNRLALLAGILDTDGSLTCNGYDYISKSKILAEDVVFVSRSLGFAAYLKSCKKKDQHGTEGTYYRVSISGNLIELPLLLEYKKAKQRLQKKDVLVTGFTTKIIDNDDYYGFELDKNHLYLTSDFIVHHNTGKSIVPAIFIKYVMSQWPTQRFLMVTHVKELIEQNHEVLKFVWPEAPVSIYSAGLKLKNAAMPIVYGGVQSMHKHPTLFGKRDIIFIDEAHLINDENDAGMYLSFLATMRLINSSVKIIGMTATHFRMGRGLITDPNPDENGRDRRIFTDIVHDLTSVDEFNKLIAQGYLSPLIPLRTREELNVEGVQIAKGEFVASQLQLAVDKQETTYNALHEMVAAGHNRGSWLIFASGLEHAEHIASTLGNKFNVQCAAVHSKQKSEYNDKAIKAFKSGELRAIANYGKLTTGFNHPKIDLIGMLRPTLSVPLWVQMLGRGTRPAEGKSNCLVLDFARNTVRLGPINDPSIPQKKGAGSGDVPVKLCDSCGAYNHARVQFCCQCGAEFQFKNKLVSKSGSQELLRSDLPVIEEYNVTYPVYSKKEKNGKFHLVVTYYCGMQSFKEFVFPEHEKMNWRFKKWWKLRSFDEIPTTVDGILAKAKQLRMPKKIKIWVNKKYPEILSVEF